MGLPTAWLAVLPWIGFSIGYALSSPLMARWVIILDVPPSKKIKAGEVVKIELPLSRLGRVTQFVGFALVMSLALLALAAATQMLAWNWRYIAVQVFTGWQKLAAFQREQKWPQNFR